MIDNIEDIFKVVAEKFGIPDIFGNSTAFYEIKGKTVDFISGNQNLILEDKVQEQIKFGGAYGFYLDTEHIEEEETFFAAIGIHEEFIPYDEKNPDELAEMIVLHEIAHLIDLQKLEEQVGVDLNECDQAIGEKIGSHITKWTPDDIIHNSNFVAILNYLIRQKYPEDFAHKLRKSLSKTLLDVESDILKSGNADESFYNCMKIDN